MKKYTVTAINTFFQLKVTQTQGLIQKRLRKLIFSRKLKSYSKNRFLLPLYLLLSFSLYSQSDRQFTLPFPQENPSTKNTKESEIEVIQPSQASTLPNQTDGNPSAPPKKKKMEKAEDPHLGLYPKGMYQLQRGETEKALVDLNQATSSEGGNTNQAKLEVVRLLAKERKAAQAKTILDGIDDLDTKFKGYFELASGLENVSNTKQEREESIPLYLQIITEAPREMVTDKKSKEKSKEDEPSFNPLLPRTRWALSNILHKVGDYTSALDHLSKIIMEYPKSEFLDDAIYLSGKIYEEGNEKFPRDTKRALNYYKIFLKKKEQEPFKSSIYLSEIEKRTKAITPNLKPFAIP